MDLKSVSIFETPDFQKCFIPWTSLPLESLILGVEEEARILVADWSVVASPVGFDETELV